MGFVKKHNVTWKADDLERVKQYKIHAANQKKKKAAKFYQKNIDGDKKDIRRKGGDKGNKKDDSCFVCGKKGPLGFPMPSKTKKNIKKND